VEAGDHKEPTEAGEEIMPVLEWTEAANFSLYAKTVHHQKSFASKEELNNFAESLRKKSLFIEITAGR